MRLLAICLTGVVLGTLAPFTFVGTPKQAFQFGAYQRQGDDFLANVLLFLPVGALLDREGRRRSIDARVAGVGAVAGAALLSATLEYAQAYVPVRDSSLVDVLANSLGALGGVLVVRSWGYLRTRREAPDVPRGDSRATLGPGRLERAPVSIPPGGGGRDHAHDNRSR
jgi:glycopeptide antibiotics resistance protein